MHSEAAWSLIDPRPVTLYLQDLDAHIVYWNGFGTTRSHALMIVGTIWNNVWSTPLMKQRAWQEFNRIYRSNGFLTRSWDKILNEQTADGYLHYANKRINPQDSHYLTRLKEQHSPRDVIDWFHPRRELVR